MVQTSPECSTCPSGGDEPRALLFTDIVGSTAVQAERGDRAWRDLLLAFRGGARQSLERWRGFENDTAGDGLYATFPDASDAVACGTEIIRIARRDLGLGVRAGVHFGGCEVAEDRCTGLAVSIGARVADLARDGEVLVTDAVREQLADGHRFQLTDRGWNELKGVPGCWLVWAVAGGHLDERPDHAGQGLAAGDTPDADADGDGELEVVACCREREGDGRSPW